MLLFVRPTNSDALDIIKEFEYIHYNSGKCCSIYAVGYTNDFTKADTPSYKKTETIMNQDWYFSSKAFVDFKNKLERLIKWEYSGETELLILQNNPGNSSPLNFQNFVAINVTHGLREGYIDSFQAFMESLVRSARAEVTAREAIQRIANKRISIKGVVSGAIDDSKKIPTPIKKVVKDRLFYRCSGKSEKCKYGKTP